MKPICPVLRTLGVLMFMCVSGKAQSPCPGTFDYADDQMYGVINIQPNGPVSYVIVKANFTIATQLPTDYYGSLEPLHNNDLEKRLARGDPLQFRVNFPVSSPLPLLTSLVVNGKLLCYGPGDIPGPNQVVTTINLAHELALSVNGQPGYTPFLTDFVVPDTLLETAAIYPPPSEVPYPSVKPTVKKTTENPVYTSNTVDAVAEAAVECGIPSLGLNALVLLGDEYLRGDWPWVVAIFKRNVQQLSFLCSGSLVSERHIITAAHCLYVRELVTEKADVVVKVGAYDLDDVSDDIAKNIYVEKATPYDTFDPHTLKDDLLILTLQKKVVYNDYIRPVCLWSEDRTDLSLIVNKRGIVTGWGANEHHEPGRGKPRKASIPVVSTETCKASREDFHKLTSDRTLCAGDRNGTGPCNGDSGGGFYMKDQGSKRWRLRGVVSLSLHSDDSEYICNVQEYIVFTDTAKYLPWIKTIMSMT